MDPKQALLDALAALKQGDTATARQYLENYQAWRHRGGFDPLIWGEDFAHALELALVK